jgi:hypothetical protein
MVRLGGEARYRKCTCGAVVRFGTENPKDSGRCMYCHQKEENMFMATVTEYAKWRKKNTNAR